MGDALPDESQLPAQHFSLLQALVVTAQFIEAEALEALVSAHQRRRECLEGSLLAGAG